MAKKKETQAERRAREKKEKLSQLAKPATAAPAEEKKPVEDTASPASRTARKSYAKAAGLKSVFTTADGELVMTAFGKGNAAIIEKRVQGEQIRDLNAPASFSAAAGKKTFRIEGRHRLKRTGVTDDPRCSEKPVGADLIGAKSALEQRYFGCTFNDNIHIQLIYNILDIEKILAVHVNNVVYSLDNILHRKPVPVSGVENEYYKEGYYDLIGYLGMALDYDSFFGSRNNELSDYFEALVTRPQLAYFGNAFYYRKYNREKKQDEYLLKSKEEIFYLLCLIGMVRNSAAHSSDKNLRRGGSPCVALYTMEERYDPMYRPDCSKGRRVSREVLDAVYHDGIDPLNQGFLNNSKKNLTILFTVLGITDPEEKRIIIRDYYDFSVRKGYKNLGFSIKKLREKILELPEAVYLKGDSFNTVRGKLYGLFDFVLFQHYKTNGVDALVEQLRATVEEREKDAIYAEEARNVWKEISGIINGHIVPFMNGNAIKEIKPDPDISEDMLSGALLTGEVSCFSKIIYLLTLLIDGKEINDLLTTLVNKLDNIASFLTVMRQENIPCIFKPEYSIFAQSAELKEELRTINSFARMQKTDGASKKAMYIEAARVLGAPGSEEELSDYFEKLLKTEKVKGKNGLRNFIAGNVIDSSRFKYLVRYNRPDTVRAIAENRSIILFVLRELPETMIVRYYNACNGVNRAYGEDMAEYLADLITGFSFDSLKTIDQKKTGLCSLPTEDFSTMNEKQKKQAAISLYLMVLYQVTKNLVYINSRYYMAFHCLERDGMLLGIKTNPYSAITEQFLAEERGKKRVREYLRQNLANSDRDAIAVFRNMSAHLNAVRDAYKYLPELRSFDSYFGMYHYVVQRTLMETKPRNGEYPAHILRYFELVRRYKTYCKDLVKALNVPFAYNLPRYKNLSIEGLFDMNRPGNRGTVRPDDADAGAAD